MGFQKVEYNFPDDEGKKPDIDVEGSSAVEIDLSGKQPEPELETADESVESKSNNDDGDYEIEVVDDTPKKDRGRKPSEPPADVTDEELEEYSDVHIITQNVDNLHERAGSKSVLHLHGLLTQVRSTGDPDLVYDIGYKDINQ